MRKILLLFFCLIYISTYSQGIKLNGPVSAENNPITNVADPTEDQDAATKSYVDSNVNNSSTNSLLAQINANIQIVDGKIVAVDNELDTLLSNLTGQLAAQLTDITAQFAAVTGEIDANRAEALIWYLNTMTGIGRVEVDLEAVDAQNAAILQQLAGMLTVVQNGFATQSAELTAAEAAILAEITLVQASQATTLVEITGLEILVATIEASIDGTGGVDEQLAAVDAQFAAVTGEIDANRAEALIWYLNTMTGIGRVEVDLAAVDAQNAAILQQLASLEASIQALQADVTTLLGD